MQIRSAAVRDLIAVQPDAGVRWKTPAARRPVLAASQVPSPVQSDASVQFAFVLGREQLTTSLHTPDAQVEFIVQASVPLTQVPLHSAPLQFCPSLEPG